MVSRYFSHFSEPDFARSGTTATQKVAINEGPLPAFSHSMEPQLRQLGLPTTLVKGRWMLLWAQRCETHSVEPSCSSYCALLSQSYFKYLRIYDNLHQRHFLHHSTISSVEQIFDFNTCSN